MSRTGDQQASNAIVSGVSFYAGALQRAHEETAHYERLVHVLSEEKQVKDKEFIAVAVRRDELHKQVVVLDDQVEKLNKQLQDERLAVAAERRRCNDLSREKSEVESKFAKLMTENERLQRVNIESHNERDKNVKSLREASESLGWFKGEAHRFIKELGEILSAKGFVIRNGDGFVIRNGDDVIAAVRKMAGDYIQEPDEDVQIIKKLTRPSKG